MQDAMGAREFPAFARILHAGFRFAQVTIAGKPGVLAAQAFGDEVPSFNPEAYRPSRPCDDGLIFFAPKVLPSQALLAKPNATRGLDVTLSRGYQLSIPLVALAPKFVSFTGGALKPATELESLALAVWERMDAAAKEIAEAKAAKEPLPVGVPMSDPDVLRLVALAVMENYLVTPELLEELRWITTRDIQPIIYALEGTDPKSAAGVEPTSPSSPADS